MYTDLHFPESIEKLVVSVGEHVQLVPDVLLRKLFGFGCAGLVARSQLNIYLYVLNKTRKCRRAKSSQEPNKHSFYQPLTALKKILILCTSSVCRECALSTDVHGGQKRASGPPELENQMVVSHPLLLGPHLF